MKTTVRVQAKNGSWMPVAVTVTKESDSPVALKPSPHEEWLIGSSGMIANTGGSDWRIYTLHQEDCARICASFA